MTSAVKVKLMRKVNVKRSGLNIRYMTFKTNVLSDCNYINNV